MNKNVIAVMGVIIISAMVFGLLTTLIDNFVDDNKKNLCYKLKLSIANEVMDDMIRMRDQQQLCNNKNCTFYFEERIGYKVKILNDTLEGKYCERYGFVETSK